MKSSEPIYVKKSGINRQGVFATKDISKGQKVCTLRGTRVRKILTNGPMKGHRNLILDVFQTSEREYIYLEEPYMLINHSCNPNVGIRGGDLIAIIDIKKGKEIVYDYSCTWYDGFECNCGSKNCRGHIGDFSGVPRSIQKKYLKLGIIPDFIKKNIKI